MGIKQENSKEKPLGLLKKYRFLAMLFAVITLVGFIYVFGIFDNFSTKLLSEPKDYKSEEIANAEEVKQLNAAKFEKLIDESAEQFVNEIEEEVEDTTKVVEEILPEPDPEPEGEEF